MSFTDTFIESYKQEITNTNQVSDTKITSSEIVSRLAKCIEENFPKSYKKEHTNTSILCNDLLKKRTILEDDLDFVKNSIRDPMSKLNMSLSNDRDPFKINTLQYSVFTTRGLFEKADFESVNCFVRVSNVENI